MADKDLYVYKGKHCILYYLIKNIDPYAGQNVEFSSLFSDFEINMKTYINFRKVNLKDDE